MLPLSDPVGLVSKKKEKEKKEDDEMDLQNSSQ
jgi:hypothetical protein